MFFDHTTIDLLQAERSRQLMQRTQPRRSRRDRKLDADAPPAPQATAVSPRRLPRLRVRLP